jgi:UDP-N-acetylmuramoyl-tripeptide--D-alanyl-D-alanine ligase
VNSALVSKSLWTAEAAAEATGGRLVGKDSWIAAGLSIDSRTLQPGDLFVALTDVRDGHDFVRDAFAKGAAAALVNRPIEDAGALLVVDGDVLSALGRLAAAARARSPARIAAITGSVGKTSVKEALAAMLAPSGATHHAVKSFNNHIGVPLTLARMPETATFAVLEIGMNNRGEIKPLAELARPDVALVTTIAPVHIENLGTLEAIADEKGDLYAGLAPGGVALVPADAPHADRLQALAERHAAHVIRFGRGEGCASRLLSYDAGPDFGEGVAEIDGKRVTYRVGAPGAQWALNGLAALTAAAVLGADFEAAVSALARLEPAEGRGRTKQVEALFGAFTLVDDAYNASPVSVAAAIETLAQRPVGPGGRRIAALGDMLELGPDSPRYHADLAEPIERFGVDLVFCAGPKMAALWERVPVSRRGGYAGDAEGLAGLLAGALKAGDVVLVKGSNGSRMMRVVDALAALGAAKEG